MKSDLYDVLCHEFVHLDPLGLIEGGAPYDEYNSEAKMIAESFKYFDADRLDSAKKLVSVMQSVFDEHFGMRILDVIANQIANNVCEEIRKRDQNRDQFEFNFEAMIKFTYQDHMDSDCLIHQKSTNDPDKIKRFFSRFVSEVAKTNDSSNYVEMQFIVFHCDQYREKIQDVTYLINKINYHNLDLIETTVIFDDQRVKQVFHVHSKEIIDNLSNYIYRYNSKLPIRS